MNAAFIRLLGVRNGGIHAVNPAEDSLLKALIARAGASPESGFEPARQVILRRPAGRPLIARCLPVAGAARDFLGLARVVLAIDDLDQPRASKAGEIVTAAVVILLLSCRQVTRPLLRWFDGTCTLVRILLFCLSNHLPILTAQGFGARVKRRRDLSATSVLSSGIVNPC
jgi:hypothetical protein